MAFNFGTPSTSTPSLGFGSAAKPAFGNSSFSFGSNAAASAAPTGFTGFGTAPGAANTGFGAPTVSSAGNTSFGGFGAPAATSAPSLFGGFGAPATTTSAFTGFGTNTTGAFKPPAPTGFGAPNTGFGAPNTGFGAPNTGFGAPNTGFGAANTGFGAANTGFGAANTGFGAPLTGFGAAAGGFGSSFGAGTGFGAGNTGFGAGGGFGTNFGAKPLGATGATTGFGGFGAGLGSFGQPQQQQQPQAPNPNEALVSAVFNVNVFGDERDQILAKWNFILAKWGVGKVYYANNQPPLELSEHNPLCRFKAIGYSCLPTVQDKDGLIQLVFNKSQEELKTQQVQIQTSLSALFGNKPNLSITIYSITATSPTTSQAMMYVSEKSATGGTGSKLSASEVAQFLGGPLQRQQLTTLGVTAARAHTRPDARQMQEYLETPPPGIDPRLWKQAQADNPNPEKYFPVPMVGFSEIKQRIQSQTEETQLHANFLTQASSEIMELKAKHAASQATLQDQTRRHMHLHHRLLSVVVRQESARRAGAAMTGEEETLRGRLEALHSQLTAPTQFNGRLSEFLSQMRMQRCQATTQSSERYSMDQGSQGDIKQFLSMQQKGMTHLIETVHKDLAHLNLIQEGMARVVHGAE